MAFYQSESEVVFTLAYAFFFAMPLPEGGTLVVHFKSPPLELFPRWVSLLQQFDKQGTDWILIVCIQL